MHLEVAACTGAFCRCECADVIMRPPGIHEPRLRAIVVDYGKTTTSAGRSWFRASCQRSACRGKRSLLVASRCATRRARSMLILSRRPTIPTCSISSTLCKESARTGTSGLPSLGMGSSPEFRLQACDISQEALRMGLLLTGTGPLPVESWFVALFFGSARQESTHHRSQLPRSGPLTAPRCERWLSAVSEPPPVLSTLT